MTTERTRMLVALAAGWNAKQWGGGCLGTVVLFVVLSGALGRFAIFR